MKFLQDYIQDKQTAAFKKYGAFFAFSKSQFDEQKVEGVKYSSLGMGLICPVGKGKELMAELEEIAKWGRKKDIKENTKERVILRELDNHECYYTNDITSAVEELEPYGITREEVMKMYRNRNHKFEKDAKSN